MVKVPEIDLPVTVPDNMPNLNSIKVWLHIFQFFCGFIALWTVVPVISAENRFYGGSQAGPNWTLVVSLLTIWIPPLLIYFPWMYHRKNKFRRVGKFALKPRTNMIFTAFCSMMWGSAAIAMTVHANNPDNCNIDTERAADDGEYESAWSIQCNAAKAAAGFSWITCILCLGTLFCSGIILWNEKQLIQRNLREHERSKQEASSLAQQEEGVMDPEEHEQHEEEHAKYQVATAVTTDVPQHTNYYHHHQTPTPTPPPHYPPQGVGPTPPMEYSQYPNETATPGMPMLSTHHY
ncbi:hypothetical protein BDA99DRAFT_518497 [Phascolomyces articulosus]|uniref:MARVEL domain-containing protein n=1 Tax=Phascolomyces articulosus TaxID=60185 RepID=A0AAD5PB92_9FUNG|nr:hypothetical protein BDA99DRAFT_518497 [Phascolomyces articulosus]